jgi:hypothetical protein
MKGFYLLSVLSGIVLSATAGAAPKPVDWAAKVREQEAAIKAAESVVKEQEKELKEAQTELKDDSVLVDNYKKLKIEVPKKTYADEVDAHTAKKDAALKQADAEFQKAVSDAKAIFDKKSAEAKAIFDKKSAEATKKYQEQEKVSASKRDQAFKTIDAEAKKDLEKISKDENQEIKFANAAIEKNKKIASEGKERITHLKNIGGEYNSIINQKVSSIKDADTVCERIKKFQKDVKLLRDVQGKKIGAPLAGLAGQFIAGSNEKLIEIENGLRKQLVLKDKKQSYCDRADEFMDENFTPPTPVPVIKIPPKKM